VGGVAIDVTGVAQVAAGDEGLGGEGGASGEAQAA